MVDAGVVRMTTQNSDQTGSGMAGSWMVGPVLEMVGGLQEEIIIIKQRLASVEKCLAEGLRSNLASAGSWEELNEGGPDEGMHRTRRNSNIHNNEVNDNTTTEPYILPTTAMHPTTTTSTLEQLHLSNELYQTWDSPIDLDASEEEEHYFDLDRESQEGDDKDEVDMVPTLNEYSETTCSLLGLPSCWPGWVLRIARVFHRSVQLSRLLPAVVSHSGRQIAQQFDVNNFKTDGEYTHYYDERMRGFITSDVCLSACLS